MNQILKELEFSLAEWNSKSYEEMDDLLRKSVPVLITNIPFSIPSWKDMVQNKNFENEDLNDTFKSLEDAFSQVDKKIKTGGEASLSYLQPEGSIIEQHNLLPKYINFDPKHCLMVNWQGY